MTIQTVRHSGELGVRPTTLSETQAGYIGVAAHGPFESDHHRY